MRAVVAIAVALALGALAADDKTLQARDYEFDQPDVTIDVGDTVTFTIASGSTPHSFAFADGTSYPPAPEPPGTAWDNQSRTFTAAGDYTYVCGAHPAMTGVIRVQAAPTPTPTATPAPSSEPLQVRSLRLTAATFCTKRGKRCRKPGVKLRIDLSQPAAVAGRLTRRAKGYGRVDFGTVAAGPRTLRFSRNASGRRLKAGRYRLELTIAGAAPRTLRFRVR
jgi:plastocyanin